MQASVLNKKRWRVGAKRTRMKNIEDLEEKGGPGGGGTQKPWANWGAGPPGVGAAGPEVPGP